jgi:accessory gene regulator protein AgrB
LITAGLVLVVANLVDLSAIASVGSAIALMIFVLVSLAGYRRRADTGAHASVAIAAIVVSAIVLVFFAIHTLRNDPATFVAMIVIAALAVALDFTWKRRSPRADVAPDPGQLSAPRA